VTACVKEVSGYDWDFPAIELTFFGPAAFRDIDDAHDNGRFAGPTASLARSVDGPTMGANPPQSCRASISLANCVGRYQAERSLAPQQTERSTEEMSHEVRIAVGFHVSCFEPCQIAVAISIDQRVLASERWISHNCIDT